MLTGTWICALCGSANQSDLAKCANCGAVPAGAEAAASQPPRSGIKPASGFATMVEPAPDRRDADNPLLLGNGLTAWTGVVTVAATDTQKHSERQATYGEGGRTVETHSVDTFRHVIRFRLVAENQDARPVQVAAELDIDDTLVFLQNGDLVTIVGFRGRNGLFREPAILNHAGRFVIMPRRALADLVFLALVTFAAIAAVLAGVPGVLRLAALLVGTASFIYLVSLVIRRAVFAAGVRTMLNDLGPTWAPCRRVDPTGSVEGVFAFTRGRQSPKEWVCFRMALPGADGEPEAWIIAAAPQSRIASDLRVGDVVTLEGAYETGAVRTARSVVVESLQH